MVFIKSMDPPTWTPGGTSAFHYIITQPFVLLHYFTTFFAPINLSADTDWKTLPSVFDVRFLVGMLFLAGLAAIGAVAARTERWRPVAFGILWFIVTLLPTSLIPLAEVMNDHRLFLPYVGLALSVCWTGHLLLAKASSRFGSQERCYRLVAVVLLATLAAYGYGTHVRNGVWRTEETLWRDVATKSPQNGRGLMNYGLALMNRGDYANAEKYFNEAMKFTPDYANLHVNMGLLKNATGKAAEAEPYFRKAIQLNPGWPGGYYWYAHFLNKQKRYKEAIPNAQKALQLAPAELEARKLLMDIYRERGQFAELRELARQTLRIAPGDVQAREHLAAAEQGEASRR